MYDFKGLDTHRLIVLYWNVDGLLPLSFYSCTTFVVQPIVNIYVTFQLRKLFGIVWRNTNKSKYVFIRLIGNRKFLIGLLNSLIVTDFNRTIV